MAITVKEAQTLFVSYFGRPADFAGLQYWTGSETLVGNLEQLAHSFFNSAEGQKYYPINPATQQIDITESINAIYANMFGRVPETAGFEYWYNEIASGRINLAEAAVAIYRGAQGKDALMIENKIAAATQFTDQVAASGKPSLYYGDKAFAKANEFLNTVTDTTDVASAGFAAQVNAAVAAAEAIGGSSYEGLTFVLTDKVDYADAGNSFHDGAADTFRFTNGNDIVEASNITLGSGDTLIDPSTTDNDKLNFNLTSSFTANSNIIIENIETFNVFTSAAVRNVDLSAADITGVKTINVLGTSKLNLDVNTLTDNVTINGNAANNTIVSGEGDDVINGNGADNVIVAGKGDDVINAGAGHNKLTGGKGADTFMITGNDTIYDLGDGADILNIAEGAIAYATVTGEFVASESNYINNGTVEFSVAANGILDLSKVDNGNIRSISISGTGAEVVGTAGDDTITVNPTSATVEGGAGDDTIHLSNSSGGATVVFEKNAVINGLDKITGFTAGSGSGKDVLDVSAFVGTVSSGNVQIGSGSGSSSGSTDVQNKLVLVDTKTGVVNNENEAKALFSTGTGSTYQVKDGQKLFFIDSASSSAGSGDKLFYVEVAGTEVKVTQVGVLDTGASGTWDNTNFA